ncbi:ATP-grasp fold amidoligase family protein [Trinickia diaoshuihuensis]|uniref:ATP-grasp fold amidoligase family protein n=1 Tax=Trinickia diaoshuihuensis TaxID=2292265 RepID=UPI001F072C2E|nr:ATP-grasp fold amidoligase family protein [Trinickia diaoshuihuensis]
MSKVAEPDQQLSQQLEPAGCDGAAFVLPGPVLTGTNACIEARGAAAMNMHEKARRWLPAWLNKGMRGAWRAAKRLLPDELFLRLSHRRHVGRFPSLAAPQTFNEFILQRCLHPEPQWSVLADKLAVREFVKQRIGEEYLIPLIAVPEVFTEELFASLPNSFVMKTNHGCAFVKIVEDKRRTSFEELNRLAQAWLAQDFYLSSRERHYRPIKPKLYFEQLLLDRAGNIPADLKMNMFGRDHTGPIIYAGIVSDRFGTPHGDVFDVNWNHLDLAVGHYPRSKVPPPKPPHWDEIVRLATRLADGLGYVRVDLYVPDGKVYFGELTFTPGAGVFPFHPDRYDYEWGQLFKNMIEENRPIENEAIQQDSRV